MLNIMGLMPVVDILIKVVKFQSNLFHILAFCSSFDKSGPWVRSLAKMMMAMACFFRRIAQTGLARVNTDSFSSIFN